MDGLVDGSPGIPVALVMALLVAAPAYAQDAGSCVNILLVPALRQLALWVICLAA